MSHEPHIPPGAEARVTLRLKDWDAARRVRQNASAGALFLLTPRAPTVGTRVELTLELPDDTKMQVLGTVEHVVTPERALAVGHGPGIGLHLDAAQQAEILRFLDARPPSLTREQVVPARGSAPSRRPPLPRPSANVARAVGIDFGTTFTSVAVVVDGRPTLVADDEGRVLFPSVVHYPDRGSWICGWEAKAHLATEPDRTVAAIKRLLGRRASDPSMIGYLQSLPYETYAGPGDAIVLGCSKTTPVAVPQAAGAIIGHVRDLAERRLGRALRDVVVSVPVTYREPQRQALRKAVALAGLDVIGLIDEPVAGALAYGLGRHMNEIVAVYDFGGGTFDFTLLDWSGDHFRVLASGGDAWLGGDDFDTALANAVADALWRATKVDVRQRAVEWQRLVAACETAKRALSADPVAHIVVNQLLMAPPTDLRQKVERTVFERVTMPLVDRSLQVVRETLASVGLGAEDVTQLVVTGGITRVPFVRERLAKEFGRVVLPVVNPEEAIALGAGVRAAALVSDRALRTHD